MKILSIEDSAIAQRNLRRLVTSMGYEFVEATEIAQGYTLAQTPVDLILLDVNLPDGKALYLARRLRAEHIPTPIIILTGDVLRYSHEKALQAGANEFVSKPYDVNEMRDLIAAHLKASRPPQPSES